MLKIDDLIFDFDHFVREKNKVQKIVATKLRNFLLIFGTSSLLDFYYWTWFKRVVNLREVPNKILRRKEEAGDGFWMFLELFTDKKKRENKETRFIDASKMNEKTILFSQSGAKKTVVEALMWDLW